MELRPIPSSSGRGSPTVGFYELHHPHSGVFCVGHSANLYVKRAVHLSQLRSGTHPNARLQIEFNHHSVVEFHWEPTEDLVSAKLHAIALSAKYSGDPLFIGGRGPKVERFRTPALSFAFERLPSGVTSHGL